MAMLRPSSPAIRSIRSRDGAIVDGIQLKSVMDLSMSARSKADLLVGGRQGSASVRTDGYMSSRLILR